MLKKAVGRAFRDFSTHLYTSARLGTCSFRIYLFLTTTNIVDTVQLYCLSKRGHLPPRQISCFIFSVHDPTGSFFVLTLNSAPPFYDQVSQCAHMNIVLWTIAIVPCRRILLAFTLNLFIYYKILFYLLNICILLQILEILYVFLSKCTKTFALLYILLCELRKHPLVLASKIIKQTFYAKR